MLIRNEMGLSFDDVLLVPKHSDITSRDDVDLTTRLGELELKLPILSANMDTVTEADMAIAMGEAGGAGVLHRFTDWETQIRWAEKIYELDMGYSIVFSIGVGGSIPAYLDDHPGVNAVCVDVAHGDHSRVVDTVKRLKDVCPGLDIIAGNVATGSAACGLVNAGATIIKIGIGPGSVCSTRVVSGHGVPQLTAIVDVCKALMLDGKRTSENYTSVIADGGIRYPGDIVKALAAGADAVMLGSLLAGTDEAPGDILMENSKAYKAYRGSASYDAQRERNSGRAPRVEGISAKVPYRGPVASTLENLDRGIRSGFSYSGARTLSELRNRAEFIRVTSNGLREGTPHLHHPYSL